MLLIFKNNLQNINKTSVSIWKWAVDIEDDGENATYVWEENTQKDLKILI